MRIIIGDQTEEYMKILGLKQYPFSSRELSSCFREMAKIKHPDKGGSNEEMAKVIVAFKSLKNLAVDKAERSVSIEEELDADMFDLFENVRCFHCDGLGTRQEFVNYHERSCPKCEGTGRAILKCKDCNDGKFTLRSGRIVECRACKGTGLFRPRCNMCMGMGFLQEPIYQEETCRRCNGSGIVRRKVDPFNPVIKRAGVMI